MTEDADDNYFEDLRVGSVRELGSYTVTKAEILEFGERWDPQPFHVGEEAAKNSIFDDLVASGLHTLCICHRVTADAFYLDTAILGSPGIVDITFAEPVYPGDTLSIRMEVDKKRALESRPTRGLVHLAFTVSNQDDETVMTSTVKTLVGRREAGESNRQ